MLLAGIVVAVALAVAWLFLARAWWFPVPISEQALRYDTEFQRTLAVMGAAFLLFQLLLGYAIWRYRNCGGPARYSTGSGRLEVAWAALAAFVFLGAGVTSTRLFVEQQFAKAPADALRVEVAARQFAWSFRYPGPDGKFGRTDVKRINEAAGNPFGIDERDPDGRDDIVSGALRVPARRPVVLTLRSRDVIHSFFVRELRLKQDVVPGMEIPLYFEAGRPGVYEIACAELCGLGHHQMRSALEVMPARRFDEWLAAQSRR